jgi:hypothetical protein
MESRTHEDIQLKHLNGCLSTHVIYTFERVWFYFHIIDEVAIPLIMYAVLVHTIDNNLAIVYSSIPCLVFMLISVCIFGLFEPVPFLICKGLYIQMIFNYFVKDPHYFPCHPNWILGIIGAQMAISSAASRSVVYFMVQPWITKNHPKRLAEWRSLLEVQRFRSFIRMTTIYTGLGLVGQAVFATCLTLVLPANILKWICPVILIACVSGSLSSIYRVYRDVSNDYYQNGELIKITNDFVAYYS